MGEFFNGAPAELENKNTPEPAANSLPSQNAGNDGITRRGALKGLAGFLGLAVTEAVIPKAWAEKTDKHFEKKEALKKVEAYVKKLTKLVEKYGQNHQEFSAPMRAQIRKEFLAGLNKELPNILTLAAQLDDHKKQFADLQINNIFECLSEFDSHGLVLKFLSDTGRYARVDDYLINYHDNFANFGRPKTADWLPAPHQITDAEIDPTLIYYDENDFDPATKFGQWTLAHPGWRAPERQKQFRDFWPPDDNAPVALLFKQYELDLVQAFSTVKAALKYREQHKDQPMSDEQIVKLLLAERSKLRDRYLLSLATKNFITYSYSAHEVGVLSVDDLSKMAKTAGVTEDALTQVEGNFENKAWNKLHSAIADSQGETTVWFNTHGWVDELGVDAEKNHGIKASDLAEALLERVFASGDLKSLEAVNIYIEACYSYDFVQNVKEEMKKSYFTKKFTIKDTPANSKTCQEKFNQPISELFFPCFVTTVQEKSYGQVAFGISPDRAVNYHREELKTAGGMKISFLQDEVEAARYFANGDMVFFAPGKGESLEIGQINSRSTETAV